MIRSILACIDKVMLWKHERYNVSSNKAVLSLLVNMMRLSNHFTATADILQTENQHGQAILFSNDFKVKREYHTHKYAYLK